MGISYEQAWRANHWHAIRSAYGNSPFFEHYAEEIAIFYKGEKYQYLWEMNLAIIQLLLDLIGCGSKLKWSETYQKAVPDGWKDLRQLISPKTSVVDAQFSPQSYPQVFTDRHGFLPNMSILDLLFCAGPASLSILKASFVSP